MKLMPLLLLVVSACGPTAASSVKEAWNPSNDPLVLGGAYARTLAALPLTGALETKPWTDTYWPSYKGGIADRWRVDGDSFAYTPPTQAEYEAMTLAQRATLSPAEKFDVYINRFDYPVFKRERSRTSPDKAHWEGICHGWAPAALNFAEPQSVLATGKNGLEVPFGASDVKALLSYYEGEIARSPARILGTRCNIDFATNPEGALRPECRDTNAGSFHVVLANQLGLLRQGFVADVTRDAQVWNQPVHGFTSSVLGVQPPSEGAAPGTVSEALVATDMSYTLEINPTWSAVGGTHANVNASRHYEYRLELDAAGAIIGGEWTSDDRPDFLWIQDRPEFRGYFSELEPLFGASLAGPALPEPI